MGAVCFAFLWVPASAGMTGGAQAGMTGCSPSPSDPLLISPWEGEGDGSRERGFNCDVKDGSGGALLFSGCFASPSRTPS